MWFFPTQNPRIQESSQKDSAIFFDSKSKNPVKKESAIFFLRIQESKAYRVQESRNPAKQDKVIFTTQNPRIHESSQKDSVIFLLRIQESSQKDSAIFFY